MINISRQDILRLGANDWYLITKVSEGRDHGSMVHRPG
jgi:hypothetical protein